MKNIKISEYKGSPIISTKGNYLRENGFEFGDIISVYISPTEIIIKKGIHTGQNWLREQLKIQRVLTTINSQLKKSGIKTEFDNFDYIPRLSINNNVLTNNGYNIGEYLIIDLVKRGEIRLTKANLDNKLITNNFQYIKDLEVKIRKITNNYYLIIDMVFDKTILSKTTFKKNDYVTLFISDGILYIKKGKEVIPNINYYNYKINYDNRNSRAYFVITKPEIFKQLNLDAGDFVSLKILTPDMLGIVKKNSTENISSINEINYIPMSYPIKNRELTKGDYINKANNYSRDGYLLKNIGYNKKDKYGFIDKINKLSSLISSEKYDELVDAFKFKETRINYYILWVLLLVKENKIDINSININELYDNLKKYDKIKFNIIKNDHLILNNLFNVNTLELNYDYESLKKENKNIWYDEIDKDKDKDKNIIDGLKKYATTSNIKVYTKNDETYVKIVYDTNEVSFKPLIYELDFKNCVYKFKDIEYDPDTLFDIAANVYVHSISFHSKHESNKILVRILGNILNYRILLPLIIKNSVYENILLKLIPKKYITNGLVKDCIELNPNFLNDFRKLNLYRYFDERELTYPAPSINSNDNSEYIPYEYNNTNKINENELSLYIRKVVRQIINESLRY